MEYLVFKERAKKIAEMKALKEKDPKSNLPI